MAALIAQLFATFLPIVRQIVSDYKAAHGDTEPTDAEIAAQFQTHIDGYLAEGAAWRASHPKAGK